MLHILHEAGDNLKWVAGVLAAISAIALMVVKFWKVLKKIADKLELLDDIPELRTEIATIKKEVTLNGGKSMKDVLVSTEKSIEKHHRNVSAKLRKMDERVQRMETKNDTYQSQGN